MAPHRRSRPTLARHARRSALLGLAAATGLGAGIACGAHRAAAPPPLPAAGTPLDDGSGVLALASRQLTVGDAEPSPTESRRGDADYYDDGYYGGLVYGGAGYGAYGGTLYGSYQFMYAGGYANPVAPFRADYAPVGVVGGGTIEGTVLWPQPPRAAASVALGAERGSCPAAVANSSLQLDDHGRVADAVVYLSDIRTGKPMPQLARTIQVGGLLERRDCVLSPPLQLVAPVTSMIRLSNADDDLARFAAVRVAPAAGEPSAAFELEVAAGGSRLVGVDRDGFIRIEERRAGGPAAWAVIQGHPYFALTDEHGGFRLDDIPVGSYELVVWHAPVLTGVDPAGQPIYGDPVVQRARVSVKSGQATSLTIKLP
jgi:hypothetical protein